ncbi:MAG: aldo/keto reductase [Proteobacteria bacterium]|nr:aldo/keto reductase [Pseudomonadota bacterium]
MVETRKIGGEDGLDVSLVGLGCNAFGKRVDEKGTHAVIDAALEAGITFFDTAETYGGGLSETFIGTALKGRRDKVILTTKFGHSNSFVEGKRKGSPENIRFAVEQSLKKLQTDYLDLYQQHRPDTETPVGDTMGALNDLVGEGKIRYFGCSAYTGGQMQEAVDVAKAAGYQGFVTAQNPWNLLERGIEDDLIPVCAENGIGILPYYPLAKGLLTGKYKPGATAPAGSRMDGDSSLAEADHDCLERLKGFAGDHGYDLLTLAISWLAAQPTMACIISGASRPDQVGQNAAAARWKLSTDDLSVIDALLAG